LWLDGTWRTLFRTGSRGGGGDNEIANMSNVHTRAISLVHFIIGIVRIMHGQFVEISSDVI
jgi:hypothetical protein